LAFQGYRHKSDKTVGENKASPTKVAGRGPVKYRTGAENKTPAPLKPAPTPDELRSTSWGRGSYGANGWGGPSSVQPGETVSAKLKVNAPVDAVLDNVIKGSGIEADDWQARNAAYADPKPLPSVYGQEKRGADSGSPGSAVPAKNGNMSSDFDARRAAAVKRTV
jgi:hypothetical protein